MTLTLQINNFLMPFMNVSASFNEDTHIHLMIRFDFNIWPS